MKKLPLFALGIALIAFVSCAKDEDEEPDLPSQEISFLVVNEVDGQELVLNELKYQNAAGNDYEASRVEYYLSDFAFQKQNGEWHRPYFEPFLVNAESTGQTFTIENVKVDEYIAMSFMLGVEEEWNSTGKLENTIANHNMQWPENLGGGYHHMKFEGNYIDDEQEIRGFTVHLGQNEFHAVNTFNDLLLDVNALSDKEIVLTMNMNEWFENPYLYDFNVDGNYTMAVDSLMEKVSMNGINCFSINIPK